MKKTLNLGGCILDLSTPQIMGILNATPDSFYSKSRVLEKMEAKVNKMVKEGADILDIGGYSTRPGASDVSIQEEIDRILPVVEYVNDTFPSMTLSVDSFRHEVLKEVVKVKDVIVNDVSGGELDASMWRFVADKKLPYILMHMRGTPQTMQDPANLSYQNVVEDILGVLQEKVVSLNRLGVKDIVIDPGIGFAKDRLDNFRIIEGLDSFNILGVPVLVGLSRKSFLWKTLQCAPEDTLPATCAMHALALKSGVSILRVHDVAEAVQIRDLTKAINMLN